MKKTIPLMLAVILLLSMSVPARAAAPVSDDCDVVASYVEKTAETPVISVTIEWEGMAFTYEAASDPVWNAETHQYEEQKGGWKEGVGTITITNDSDMILKAGLAYTKEDKFGDVDMKFTHNAPYIGSAFNKAEGGGDACSVQILAVPVGDLTKPDTQEATIGNIKVTVESGAEWTAVADDIEGEYRSVMIPGDTAVDRGAAYFESKTVQNAVQGAYEDLMDLVDGGTIEGPELNAKLNALITAYYNAIKIGQ